MTCFEWNVVQKELLSQIYSLRIRSTGVKNTRNVLRTHSKGQKALFTHVRNHGSRLLGIEKSLEAQITLMSHLPTNSAIEALTGGISKSENDLAKQSLRFMENMQNIQRDVDSMCTAVQHDSTVLNSYQRISETVRSDLQGEVMPDVVNLMTESAELAMQAFCKW